MVIMLLLTKIIAQTTDTPTTTSYTTEEEDYEDEGDHDCCNDKEGCPFVSNSIYMGNNGTTLNVVCLGCSSDHKNFTLLWLVNGTVVENNTDAGFTYHTSLLDASDSFSSASIFSSTKLNRHDYDNSNITCVLKDTGGSSSDSFDTGAINKRYNKILHLKAHNITLKDEEEFENYTITVKK
ncbi:interleukin 18 binding protein [Finch poxvirus]|uniref:Interleukin 18 binding protein n=1 Tax=Condorpox virus TaxID=3049970 RepID=A0AAT9UP61_9POXV|nr:interleukin 18 binding protein [Finch poxvirus]UOX39018.1 interleukin 18 binding protein [Finch poxvirus]